MRWVSSSSSDVLSFYSLPDGVQHVLPTVVDVCQGGATRCMTPCTRAGTSKAQPSEVRVQQQDRVQNVRVDFRRDASSIAGIKRNCQRSESRYAGLLASHPVASPPDARIDNPDIPASRQLFHLEDLTDTHPIEDYHTDCISQRSLGYMTTCVFSGGWGGYDETEVTVGTTEGYVYALSALWPPPHAVACDGTSLGNERGSLAICWNCQSSLPGVPPYSVTTDGGNLVACLCAACKGAVGDGGLTAKNGAARADGSEETSSLAFPTSYVAAPVKRLFRLPYTVQHLQMLGAHTPALAGDYHVELLWMQQEDLRHRTPLSRTHGFEVQSAEHLETEKRRRCTSATCSHDDGNGCENTGGLDCVSCCCRKKTLLSAGGCDQCCCSQNISHSNCFANSFASPALHAPRRASERSRDLASRVHQFFSSDRLLLALDKGGNGVVAHWPAPPYLHNWLSGGMTSTICDQTQCGRVSTWCGKSSRDIVAPLAASFSLHLSLQCCASNPVITPLLAVVPCAVAAGGLRLLSVYDLVTSSFVFYARPPILQSSPPLSQHHAERGQSHCHYAPHALAEAALPQPRSPRRQTGLIWTNMCCLSRSPSSAADTTQPSASPREPGAFRPYGTGTTGAGLRYATTVSTGKNIPISISSLTWLPALHPLLLGASTDSGLLLLYDLRASPHPVFCGSRPCSAAVSRSTATSPRPRDARAPAPHIADCFYGGLREACNARKGVTEAASSETPRGVVEPASLAGPPSSTAVENCIDALSSKEILYRQLAGRLECGKDVRRGSSLDVRGTGKSSYERTGPESRLCRSSFRCSSERRGQRYSKSMRGEKTAERKSMRISFLTTPAWLTSAAVSHDAAILPCGCRCCRHRAAEFSRTDAPCDLQKLSSTPLLVAKARRPELVQSNPTRLFEGITGVAQKRDLIKRGSLTIDDSYQRALFCTQSEGQDLTAKAEGVVHKDETSLFEGCAATIVIKPRNSSRPRPRLRRRSHAKRIAFRSAPGCWKTGKQRSGCSALRVRDSNKLPDADLSCKSASSLCDAVSAAASTQHRRSAAAGLRRLRSRSYRQRHDTSWRRRWFARQEKALVNFFTERYNTLLSDRLGKDENFVSASLEVEASTPTTTASPPTFSEAGQACKTRSSSGGAPECALSPSDPLVSKEAIEKRGQKRRFESVFSSPDVLSSSSSTSYSDDASMHSTKTEAAGAVSAASCVSAAVMPDLRGRFVHSARSSAAGLLRMRRSDVLAGKGTATDLPFDLLRLASLPCSVLAGFPSIGQCSKPKTLAQSSCSSEGQQLRLLYDITTPFIASCFFPIFARLLYAHRLDQHVVAGRLSYHEGRQLLKLLHAADCPDIAHLPEGLSLTDAAITALNAAEVAAVEARLAEADARAAGIAGAEPAGAAAVATTSVDADAPEISGARLRPPREGGFTQQESLQLRGGPETSGHAGDEAFGIIQDISLSGVCSASRATPAPQAPGAREPTPPLLNFKNKLLSLYNNVVLDDRRNRTMQRKTVALVHDWIEHALPDLFSRHAQNCMQLLRYAAAVLYAFGDAAPVLAKGSATVGKAVQAAASCAVGLEVEKFLCNQQQPASIVSPNFWTDSHSSPLDSSARAAARGVRLATSTWGGNGVQDSKKIEQGNADNELRCGCGRVEAALKAKVRRWIADEFIRDVRLSMKNLFSERSSLMGTEQSILSPMLLTDGKSFDFEGKDRKTAEECAGLRQVVAATHVVASSICFCELFQSATFFPILFFNVFRHLVDRVSGVPFCIQKNCIRTLPVSDVTYQKLARSQLRALTRDYCGIQSAPPAHPGVGKVGRATGDVSGEPPAEVSPAATCTASSISSSEVTCCGFCRRATQRTRCTDAGKNLGRSVTSPREQTDSRRVKDQKRTQQLFCLDERGCVRVLFISLWLGVSIANEHENNADGRATFVNSNMPDADKSGRSDRDKDYLHEDSVHCVLCKQAETRPPALSDTLIQSQRDKKDLTVCKNIHVHSCCRADCAVQLTSSNYETDTNLITPEQTPSNCLNHLQGCDPSLNSSTRERFFSGLERNEELLPVDRDEHEYFCTGELESGVQNCRLQRKMWKEQWLRCRRRSEWCGACTPVTTEAFCTHTSRNPFSGMETGNFGSAPMSPAEILCATHEVVSAATAGNLTTTEAPRKAMLPRSRPRVGTRGGGRGKKAGKHSVGSLDKEEEIALIDRIARTTTTFRLAQINANLSLLRLFPLLPLWNSLKPRRLWRLRSELQRGRRTLGGRAFCLSLTNTCSYGIQKGTQTKVGSSFVNVCDSRESCRTPGSATKGVATDAAGVACAALEKSLVAKGSDTATAKSDVEVGRLATPGAAPRENAGSGCSCTEQEHRREGCRRVCCYFQVEEEACFEVNGITSCGHFEKDSRRSRVMSLAIHENGKYVLAATCAPSFLLYSSSSTDPLSAHERKDRLLFGCATGSVPHSSAFRLLCTPPGACTGPVGSSPRNMPAVHLPRVPSGPRPPPPLLISASPILPPPTVAPFLPHTLLRRHADHDVAYGVSCNRTSVMRRRAGYRPRKSVVLKRQNADLGCMPGGIRRETAFSDWLTDEEDERELHGGSDGSESGSVSDT